MAPSKKRKKRDGAKAKPEPLLTPKGEAEDDDGGSAHGAAAVLANPALLERVLSFLPKLVNPKQRNLEHRNLEHRNP
jgi:hypothetical protein